MLRFNSFRGVEGKNSRPSSFLKNEVLWFKSVFYTVIDFFLWSGYGDDEPTSSGSRMTNINVFLKVVQYQYLYFVWGKIVESEYNIFVSKGRRTSVGVRRSESFGQNNLSHRGTRRSFGWKMNEICGRRCILPIFEELGYNRLRLMATLKC